MLRISTSGAIYRGAPTLYNGKLYRLTLDAHLVALDMKTGKQLWKKPFANHLEGYKGVSAPLIANGVMITGTRAMPPWGDVIKPDEIQALWAYVVAGEPGNK